MTEAQLRRDIRQQLFVEQIAEPIGRMPRVAQTMAQPYAALLLEKRRGLATFIPASPFAPRTDPGDKALQTWLTQNRSRYSIPERRVNQYALFDRDTVDVRSEERRVGKELSVRVDIGGRRINKQKTKRNIQTKITH